MSRSGAAAEPLPRVFHAQARDKQDPLDEIPAYQRADLRTQPKQPSSVAHRAAQARFPVDRAAQAKHLGAHAPKPVASRLCPSRDANCGTIRLRAATPAMQPQPVAPATGREPVDPWRAIARRRIRAAATPEKSPFTTAPTPKLHTATVAPKNVSGFKLPSSTLLSAGEGPQSVREDELREEAKVLVEKCAEFDVRGQVVQINPGPMVTTFEFKPEAGVKYSRVTGLADDLCLAMRAESILIERMPGKSTVGIQVPNHERETIHLRDVIESETFAKARSRLTLSMGKDINGRIVTADLASMPHVLIAGSTGSGKSVAINAMIMSLLYRTTPHQVRLILVDPKRVELGMYEGIPHLFTPIITEPKLAANALRNAVREMERRLKLLASRSVRNIDQYNKLFEGSTAFAL